MDDVKKKLKFDSRISLYQNKHEEKTLSNINN